MQLTDHFTIEEFEYSSTARAHGIRNKAPMSAIGNARTLCQEVLEPLRQHLGKPIIISSGYRCPKLNKLVGGSPNSQHLTGEAADLHTESLTELKEWFTWIMDNCNFDQLILERASKTSNHWWIHVSCKYDTNLNRHQVIQGLIKTR